MLKIGKIGQFQRLFKRLIQKKPPEDSQGVSKEIVKSMWKKAGYHFIRNVKIYDVDLDAPDGKILTLDDGSLWSPVEKFGLDQNHALHWSPGDPVSLRLIGGNIFVLTNSDAEETSRWIFQGYVENWGKS